MRILLIIALLWSSSIFSQTDSLRYYYLNSNYQKIVNLENRLDNFSRLDKESLKIVIQSYKAVGDYRTALRVTSKAESKYIEDKDFAFTEASLLYKYGRLFEAQQKLQVLIKTDSLNSKYNNLAERICKHNKNYHQARKLVSKLLSVDSLNPTLNYKQGYYSTKLKDYDRALEALSRTIRLDTTYVDAYRWMAKIFSAHQAYDTALYFINKAIKYEPNNLKIKGERGDINYKKGHYFRARTDYQKLVDAKQDKLETKYKLGVCYVEMRQPQKAIPILKEVYQKDSLNYKHSYSLGLAYKKLNKLKLADSFFNKALALQQPDRLVMASIYRQLVLLYQASGNKEAMDKALKGFDKNSNDYYLLYKVARDYDKNKQTSLALEYYTKLSTKSNFPKMRVYETVKNRIKMLKEDLFFEKK